MKKLHNFEPNPKSSTKKIISSSWKNFKLDHVQLLLHSTRANFLMEFFFSYFHFAANIGTGNGWGLPNNQPRLANKRYLITSEWLTDPKRSICKVQVDVKLSREEVAYYLVSRKHLRSVLFSEKSSRKHIITSLEAVSVWSQSKK